MNTEQYSKVFDYLQHASIDRIEINNFDEFSFHQFYAVLSQLSSSNESDCFDIIINLMFEGCVYNETDEKQIKSIQKMANFINVSCTNTTGFLNQLTKSKVCFVYSFLQNFSSVFSNIHWDFWHILIELMY